MSMTVSKRDRISQAARQGALPVWVSPESTWKPFTISSRREPRTPNCKLRCMHGGRRQGGPLPKFSGTYSWILFLPVREIRAMLVKWQLVAALIGLCTSAPQPHILFLIVDGMDGRILEESAQLPMFMREFLRTSRQPVLIRLCAANLRALADSGIIFPTAYSNAPACVPARASMLTGRHTHDLKVWDNYVGLASGLHGDIESPDEHCVAAFGKAYCQQFARKQRSNGTFLERLSVAGYNVTLYGKMHVVTVMSHACDHQCSIT